jgi:hypothetical protein
MHCPRCQHDNREGRRFCAECGASLALACPSCGVLNEPGEKYFRGRSGGLFLYWVFGDSCGFIFVKFGQPREAAAWW